jgi:phospholipid transport system substrate-binding protein
MVKTTVPAAVAVFSVILLCLVSPGTADSPIDALRLDIEAAIDVLNRPEFQNHDHRDRQYEELQRILHRSFDFEEFSKRTLGRQAEAFDSGEVRDFDRLFSSFLSAFYLRQLQDRYTDQTIRLDRQLLLNDRLALIRSTVDLTYMQVPVDIHMIKGVSGRWKAFDVVIYGISAINNYRQQLGGMLRRDSLESVNQLLEEKLAAEERKNRG